MITQQEDWSSGHIFSMLAHYIVWKSCQVFQHWPNEKRALRMDVIELLVMVRLCKVLIYFLNIQKFYYWPQILSAVSSAVTGSLRSFPTKYVLDKSEKLKNSGLSLFFLFHVRSFNNHRSAFPKTIYFGMQPRYFFFFFFNVLVHSTKHFKKCTQKRFRLVQLIFVSLQ